MFTRTLVGSMLVATLMVWSSDAYGGAPGSDRDMALPDGNFGGGQPTYGDPIPGLTEEQLDQFFEGKEAFQVINDIASGLGPIFNKEGCAACHNAGEPQDPLTGIGGAGTESVTRFGRYIGKGVFDPMEEYGGSLRQSAAIGNGDDCLEVVPEEATIEILRLTTPMFGAGLIEAIPDDTLMALADPNDDDGDGISGRVHMVFDEYTEELRVGRFGWKAQVATLETFSADASLNESGITTVLFPEENDPNGIFPPELIDCDTIEDPEDVPDVNGVSAFEKMSLFQRFLAPPPRTPLLDGEGFALFKDIGCADCHVPVLFTGDSEHAVLAHRPAFLFSDLLLHDMGALGDEIVQGDAQGTEMRTSPLWGLRVRPKLLHDGRANNSELDTRIREAIEGIADPHQAGHAGEAAASRDAWYALTPEQQAKIIEFLESI